MQLVRVDLNCKANPGGIRRVSRSCNRAKGRRAFSQTWAGLRGFSSKFVNRLIYILSERKSMNHDRSFAT
jgi:hypothetical protein